MTITTIIQSGLSGLAASQRGLQAVSQNLANANTPGYARVDLQHTPAALSGGVEYSVVRRAADQFLAAASFSSSATYNAQAQRADLLDRAQGLFGDPGDQSSVFAMIDRAFAAFAALGADAESAIRRGSVIGDMQVLFAETSRIAGELEAIRLDADRRVADKVAEANVILRSLHDLNGEIARNVATGADVSSTQNAQAALIDQLAAITDVRVVTRTDGVEIRTQNGGLLLGERPVTLRYAAQGVVFGAPGTIQAVDPAGVARPFDGGFSSGQIGGLLQARDIDLPRLAEALGALTAATADALNAAHNDNTAQPAPASLTGRETGLDGADAHGFTGLAHVGVVDAAGALTRRITIDFTAGQVLDNGVAAGAPFTTLADLAARLDAISGLTAGFDGLGRFSIGAETAGHGVSVRQDETSPAARAGRGFSHFFGLNDVVTRSAPGFFETGLRGDAPHRFSADPITFLIRDRTGAVVAERNVIPAAGQTINQLLGQINANSGIGPYGSMALLAPANAQDTTGRTALSASPGYSIEVVSDASRRGSGRVSFTQLFGVGASATAGRATDYVVAAPILADNTRLALARPDLAQAVGVRVLEAGDGRGAQALAAAQDVQRDRPAAGLLTEQSSSLARYMATFAGETGRAASEAERMRDSALAIQRVAAERRTAAEGVRIDDELVRMTQYQQSYAAASRLIQAAKEMFDILLSIR